MFLDDVELIENDGNHAAVEEPGTIGLKAGFHSIRVNYIQCGGGKAFNVSWEGPSFGKCEVRGLVLFH